jgi:hypothetical protein
MVAPITLLRIETLLVYPRHTQSCSFSHLREGRGGKEGKEGGNGRGVRQRGENSGDGWTGEGAA